MAWRGATHWFLCRPPQKVKERSKDGGEPSRWAAASCCCCYARPCDPPGPTPYFPSGESHGVRARLNHITPKGRPGAPPKTKEKGEPRPQTRPIGGPPAAGVRRLFCWFCHMATTRSMASACFIQNDARMLERCGGSRERGERRNKKPITANSNHAKRESKQKQTNTQNQKQLRSSAACSRF